MKILHGSFMIEMPEGWEGTFQEAVKLAIRIDHLKTVATLTPSADHKHLGKQHADARAHLDRGYVEGRVFEVATSVDPIRHIDPVPDGQCPIYSLEPISASEVYDIMNEFGKDTFIIVEWKRPIILGNGPAYKCHVTGCEEEPNFCLYRAMDKDVPTLVRCRNCNNWTKAIDNE